MKNEEQIQKKINSITNQIKKLVYDSNIDYWIKKNIALDIAFEAINWASETGFEGIGMCEQLKDNYKYALKIVEEEENDEAIDEIKKEIKL